MTAIEDDLISLTAVQAAEAIANGEMSAEEYVGACLDRIAAIDSEVQAFAHLDPACSLEQESAR
jgi:Asp-tRNA(Asn)/Glu-tRNA(Gln) amidotransferase A subunit family amidase